MPLDLIALIARLLAHSGELNQACQVDRHKTIEALHALKLLQISLERLRINVIGGFSAVGAKLQDKSDRPAPEPFAEDAFQLRLQSADGVRQLYDGLEEAVVQR